MIVERLKLRNYRNYENVEIEFSKGLNLICGINGAGKTNIVEAIYYLSLARSFRTTEFKDLIKHSEQFATIDAEVLRGERRYSVNICITENKRVINVNRKEINRISELSEVTNVIVFEPKDVGIFQTIPKSRRNYIDLTLSKASKVYVGALSAYEKLLRERNEILKQEQMNKQHLEIITSQMIDLSYKIAKQRSEFLKNLEPTINKVIRNISQEKREVTLHYHPFVEVCEKEQYLTYAKKAFERALENDLKRRVTTIGIHREDFSTGLNQKNLAAFGSQGEKRMVAIALKVAPYFLIKDQESRPVVVLDDVLSELDEINAQRLITFFSKFEQVFITATESEVKNASKYEVINKKIRRISYDR